jgi:hypothetical protein
VPVVSNTYSQYQMTCYLWLYDKSSDNLVAVQEMELAINLAILGVLCILGNQYMVGILFCFGSTQILNFSRCWVYAATISLSDEEVSV